MRARDEHKESAIRQKAMEMIVAEGFDGFSMQKLAKAANVSPATLYIYFKNREDLLNQLFNEVQQTFSDVTLQNFSLELSFEDGLWLQWNNRLKFILDYPAQFYFYEQFRNSPLVNNKDVKMSAFREKMRQFVGNSVQRGEIRRMETEVFWAIAYGPLYSLARFHLDKNSFSGKSFVLTDENLRQTFSMVIRALRRE